MIDSTPSPSPLLKVAAFAALWALRLVALAWIVFAIVWGSLHFVIVPRIEELRPRLEQLASKSLGMTVQIGALSARSNDFIPSIALQNVVVLDGLGRVALQLPSILVAVSPRSLLALGFEQLYIENPVLEIRRSPDGQIWIAGFAIPKDTENQDGPLADWIFSQAEFAIRNGTVHWTDELRAAPMVTLTQVQLVLRNRLLTHTMRIEASPPAAWGSKLAVNAQFTAPLLARRAGQWKQWTGQLYAHIDQFDFATLRPYVDTGDADIRQGAGAVRAWMEIDSGSIRAVTADLALQDVRVRTKADLEPVALRTVAGRLGLRINGADTEYFTQSLQFDTADGLHWPGGNLRLKLSRAGAVQTEGGSLLADTLDIAAMGAIAERLPLNQDLRAALRQWSASGRVDRLQADWKGPWHKIDTYSVKGRVKQLQVPLYGAARTSDALPRPAGIQGLEIDFDLNQAAGKASLALRRGQMDTFGLLDQATIGLDQLSAELEWKHSAQATELTVKQLQFSNADVQGSAQFRWQSAPSQPLAPGSTPALGILDLQGALSRLDLAALHRYLPKVLDKDLRAYLRESLVGGRASEVKYRVKGDLQAFPFTHAAQGDFHIAGQLQNVNFAYAPARLMPQPALPWPTLQGVSAQLLIDNDVLQIKNATGGIAGTSNWQFSKAEAKLSPLFGNAILTVNAEAKGALPEVLKVVNTSPLSDMMGHVLAQSSTSGNADYRLKLSLPIMEPERATVQGQISFNGNDVQIRPDIPRLTQVRGQLAFTENGFSVKAVQARALGGEVRLQGGLHLHGSRPTGAPAAPDDVLRIQGTATAAGLRQAQELGALTRLGQYASGSTTYSAVLSLRAGTPEIIASSTLAGLGLALPAPFGKSADTVLPVRFENSLFGYIPPANAPFTAPAVTGRLQDKLQLTVGKEAEVTYIRDIAGSSPRVLRGSIAVGLADDESAPLPPEGVIANINLGSVDLNAWDQVFNTLQSHDSKPAKPSPAADDDFGMAYLPTMMALRTRDVSLDGRTLHNVVVGGGRSGLLWRANLDATELSGYVEYLQPSARGAGRLYARLARLSIEQSQAQAVESLLDEQPANIPALDIVIQDFELRGKKLGRIDVEAVNRGTGATRDQPREWRLNRFNITMPEAVLTAGGNWSSVNAGLPAVTRGSKALDRRRTVLNFKLDISDAGALLQRFGMVGVVRKGSGKIEGQVAWQGSPITLDLANLGGNFNINIEKGQFLKAEPGIAKLIGVLSLQSLPRRLTLDFRDVFSEGFSFDFLRGDVTIDSGMARTNNLQMKGVNAAVLMEGQADIVKETQSIKVVVIPEINAGSASLIATAINPVIGLSTFLAQVLLRRPLIEAATQQFMVDGTWLDPRVTRIQRQTAAPETPP